MNVNMTGLNALVGKMVGEIRAAANGVPVTIGDKLGLFRNLSRNGPLTAAELAERTGTFEGYVREWLAAQAASRSAAAVYASELRLTLAFRTGEGIGWGQHCPCLFCGINRSPGRAAGQTSSPSGCRRSTA